MALVTYTLISSSNKKNKGAKYPRFRINLQNGSKPFFKPFKDILIYKRPDTPEKKKLHLMEKECFKRLKMSLKINTRVHNFLNCQPKVYPLKHILKRL